MDDAFRVLDDGVVYIQDDRIAAVLESTAPAPDSGNGSGTGSDGSGSNAPTYGQPTRSLPR